MKKKKHFCPLLLSIFRESFIGGCKQVYIKNLRNMYSFDPEILFLEFFPKIIIKLNTKLYVRWPLFVIRK